MQLAKNATVAVVDGEKFNLFRNASDEAGLPLVAVSHDQSDVHRNSAGAGRHSSSAIPDGAQDSGQSSVVFQIASANPKGRERP